MSTLVVILSVIAFGIVLASMLEGLFHQFILHTGQRKLFGGALYVAYHAHAIEHHPAYRAENYHRPAPEEEAKISLGPFMLPATLLFISPITAFLWWQWGATAGITLMAVATAYYAMYEFLHWHMHFPRADGKPRFYHSWAPSRQLFEWFDKRHYIHHIADDRNFNVVIPIYDIVTGRYTTDENKAPWAVRRRREKALAKSAAIRAQVEEKKRERATAEVGVGLGAPDAEA
jgi:hypothetical protein